MIKATTRSDCGFRVFRDRVHISTHDTEREAIQVAVRIKADNPTSYIHYDHDYSVDVDLDDA